PPLLRLHQFSVRVLPFFPVNSPAPPHPYTLSLHDALPISCARLRAPSFPTAVATIRSTVFLARQSSSAISEFVFPCATRRSTSRDRKSTRLNSSHLGISYAVFCLKKKTNNT